VFVPCAILTMGALRAAAVLAAMAAAEVVGCSSLQPRSTLVMASFPCTAAAAQRPNMAPSAICTTATAGMAKRLAGWAAVSVLVVLASSMAGMVTLKATWKSEEDV